MTRSPTNLLIFVVSLAGCVLSLFLTQKYLEHQSIPCGMLHSDCDTVANDHYAKGLGISALAAIPTPAFGAVMYAGLAALSFFRAAAGSPRAIGAAKSLQMLLAGLAFLVSAGLTWREATISHWCLFCLASAIMVTIIFIAACADQLAKRSLPEIREA